MTHPTRFARLEPELRKSHLVEATLKCLKQHGFQGASIRKICKGHPTCRCGQVEPSRTRLGDHFHRLLRIPAPQPHRQGGFVVKNPRYTLEKHLAIGRANTKHRAPGS